LRGHQGSNPHLPKLPQPFARAADWSGETFALGDCFSWWRLAKQRSDDKIDNVSFAEIKNAIEQLSFEQRADLAAWFHGWKDDDWDEQMKRDIATGKLDSVLREVEEDIKAGRVREML
jgi:hypothetical protein